MWIVIFYNDYHGTEIGVNRIEYGEAEKKIMNAEGRRYGQEGKVVEEA